MFQPLSASLKSNFYNSPSVTRGRFICYARHACESSARREAVSEELHYLGATATHHPHTSPRIVLREGSYRHIRLQNETILFQS